MLGSGCEQYLAGIERNFEHLIDSADIVCTEAPHLDSLMDKPNIYGLLERFKITIPIFRHICDVCELICKKFHKYLIQCCIIGNHQRRLHSIRRACPRGALGDRADGCGFS